MPGAVRQRYQIRGFRTDGARVRELRELSGYSLQDVADATGLTQVTVMRIELGRNQPRPSTLRKLAAFLGVEVRDLLVPIDEEGKKAS